MLNQEIEVSKELSFYRESLNGLCVTAHMVENVFTEHMAVMSSLQLDALRRRREYMQGEEDDFARLRSVRSHQEHDG